MGSAASSTPAASSAATEWYTHRGVGSLTRTGSLIRRHRAVHPCGVGSITHTSGLIHTDGLARHTYKRG